MIFIRLFITFMKIGFTSFGGMSMVPVIMQQMKSNQWMSAEDLTNLIAIAEMTPGPLGINCATFAGMQTAGVLGGIAAVMGVLMPENYFPKGRIDWFGCGIGLSMFCLILQKNWTVPKIIVTAALLGVAGYGVLGIG